MLTLQPRTEEYLSRLLTPCLAVTGYRLGTKRRQTIFSIIFDRAGTLTGKRERIIQGMLKAVGTQGYEETTVQDALAATVTAGSSVGGLAGGHASPGGGALTNAAGSVVAMTGSNAGAVFLNGGLMPGNNANAGTVIAGGNMTSRPAASVNSPARAETPAPATRNRAAIVTARRQIGILCPQSAAKFPRRTINRRAPAGKSAG